MDIHIAQLNIERFQKLLAKEQDEERQKTIRCLLAEEEAKLAALVMESSKATGSAPVSTTVG